MKTLLKDILEINATPILIILAIIYFALLSCISIPVVSCIYCFAFILILPGFLVLEILGKSQLSIAKRISISVGLSVGFLVSLGLFLSFLATVLPLDEPLSKGPVVFSIIILSVFLVFIYIYQLVRDRKIKDSKESFYYLFLKAQGLNNGISKSRNLSIFVLLLPCMCIIGKYVMDIYNNNYLLMFLVFIIPLLVVYMYAFPDNISEPVFPLALFSIAISLLLYHSLTSGFIIGTDIHSEFHAARIVLENNQWLMEDNAKPVMGCLVISVLPPMLANILGTDLQSVFKINMQIIFAITPVILYLIFSNYFKKNTAYLLSFIFIAQNAFIYHMVDHVRTAIALFYFALSILIMFDNNVTKLQKEIIMPAMFIMVVFSHYTVAYIFAFILIGGKLLSIILLERKNRKLISGYSTLTLLCATYLWWGMLTQTSFNDLIFVSKNTITRMTLIFSEDLRSESVQYVISGSPNLSTFITLGINILIFGILSLGILLLSFEIFCNKTSTKLPKEFIILMIISWVISCTAVAMPYISVAYGMERLYLQCLVLLAPAYIVVVTFLQRTTNRFGISKSIICGVFVFIIVLNYMCGLYLAYEVFGVNYSEDINKQGERFDRYYIHEVEVVCARWLNANNAEQVDILTDHQGIKPMTMYFDLDDTTKISEYGYKSSSDNPYYLYLRRLNVNGIFHSQKGVDFSSIIVNANLVCNLGGSKIYYGGGHP